MQIDLINLIAILYLFLTLSVNNGKTTISIHNPPTKSLNNILCSENNTTIIIAIVNIIVNIKLIISFFFLIVSMFISLLSSRVVTSSLKLLYLSNSSFSSFTGLAVLYY